MNTPISKLTNYDREAENFAKLPEYSIHCGTDYLALKDVPNIINQYQPVNKILDLGCGSGLATRYLKKHFPKAKIIGADINKNMLEHAVTSDPDGMYVHLQQLDQQIFYPFLPNFFDVIVCSFVIHENQTLKELEMFLNNISKMLRPGGVFLAWDPCQNFFQGKWLNIEKISPLNDSINEGEQYTVKISPADAVVTGTHWSPETISKIATSQSLQTICIHYPIAEKNSDINWMDEIRLAPYFLMEARKVDKL